MSEDMSQYSEWQEHLGVALAEAFRKPPMTPEQKARTLTDMLNAKSKVMGEGAEYTLTGIDGEMAHFDVKQSLPHVFVINVKI